MPISEDDLEPSDEGRLCLASGEPFTGVTEDHYEDGQVASRGHFLAGLMHGLQQEWYGTGQIRSEETMCLGQPHGYRREWYPDGRLKCEGGAARDLLDERVAAAKSLAAKLDQLIGMRVEVPDRAGAIERVPDVVEPEPKSWSVRQAADHDPVGGGVSAPLSPAGVAEGLCQGAPLWALGQRERKTKLALCRRLLVVAGLVAGVLAPATVTPAQRLCPACGVGDLHWLEDLPGPGGRTNPRRTPAPYDTS